MDYRQFGGTWYIRVDRGEEIVASILEVCAREGIASATYSGIGGCSVAEIQTFDPAQGRFRTERLEGMLELVSFTGNIISDDAGERHHHTHALFAYVDGDAHRTRGGHIKSSTVRYTAEIELRPVPGKGIGYMLDEETGTGFWAF